MRWIFLFLTICIYAPGSTQNATYKSIVPRITHTLGIEDGLPTTCFEQVKVDDAGRMWLVTCADAQINRQINLIQFASKHLNYKVHLAPLFSSVLTVAEDKKFVVYKCIK